VDVERRKDMGFGSYLIKRLIIIFITLFVIVNLQFLIFQVLSPIDPARVMIPLTAPPELAKRLRELFGLNKTILERYFIYIRNLYTFEFGISFKSRNPVIKDIMTYLPNTLYLLGLALVIELIIGIIAGLTAASKRGKTLDVAIVSFGLISWAMPAFILQLLFRFTFVHWLKWFPYGGVPVPTNYFDYLSFNYLGDLFYHTVLPLTTLVVMGFGIWAFYTRNLLVDVMTQDYILTARAKGVKERTIVSKHAFRAILPTVLTFILMSFPGLLTGSIITEVIFSWPGIGLFLIQAINVSDYPVLQAMFFIYSILMLSANFLADLLYGYLDPRIRVGFRR
jgi:peptide/nickel transport system permease protein